LLHPVERLRKICREQFLRIPEPVRMGDKAARLQIIEIDSAPRARRQYQGQFIGAKPFTGQPRMVRCVIDNADIEIARQNAIHDPRLRRCFQADHQPGRTLHQAKKMRIDQHGETAGAGQRNLAHIRIVRAQRLMQGALSGAAFAPKSQYRLTCGSSGKTLAVTGNQRLPDLCLKLLQMLRDARLGHVQLLGGTREVPRLAKGYECLEPSCIQHTSLQNIIYFRSNDNFKTCIRNPKSHLNAVSGDFHAPDHTPHLLPYRPVRP